MPNKKENQSGTQFNLGAFLTKNSMVIALVVVFVLFYFLTDGRLLYAQNMSNLLLQNGYVLVMACGMLLCILTGGNIDLSVGSVICMVGGVAAVLITNYNFNVYLTILICLAIGIAAGVWQGYWILGELRGLEVSTVAAPGSAMSASPPSSPPWAACLSSAASGVWCWTARRWRYRIRPS